MYREVLTMTNNDADATPAVPKKPRRSRASTKAVSAIPPAEPQPVAQPDESPPGIDEDGAWIVADAVEVHQGAIGRVDATDVAVTQGAVGAARADRVSVEMGALGAALAREVSISQGAAGTIVAREVRVEQAFVRSILAREVSIHRPSAVVFLLAQKVSGEVKVLLDWRGALAFGASFGILSGLLGRGRRKS